VPKAYEQIQARAFHPDLGNEPIDGTIFFTANSLTFQGGETAIDMSLERLDAQLEDVGEGRLIFRDPAHLEWTIITSDMSILEMRSIPAIQSVAEQLESSASRRELSRRGKMVVYFLVGAGLAFWLGMLAIGAMVRSIVARLPPEMEQEVGTGLLNELKGELQFSSDTNQVARLTTMAQPLLRALPASQQWKFYIVEEESPNAFALPGGHIVVTDGLLKMAERPEELLGVVAHEVAHVTEKHGFRHTIASAGPFLVFQVFLSGRGGALGAVAGGSAFLVDASFSQEYEKEADDVGWKYMISANIDPRGMIEMFHKLKVIEASEHFTEVIPKAFQSHPDLDKRIARLEKKWKRLPRKAGFIQLESADSR
jgi:Zn-dependent protease with chaperone function